MRKVLQLPARLHNDIPLQLTFAIPRRWPRTPATGLITTDSRAQRQNWTVGVAAQSLSGSGRTATERVKSASCPSWGNNRSAVATSAQILNNVAARLGIPEVFATPTPPRYLQNSFSRGACCDCTSRLDRAQRAFSTKQRESAAPATSASASAAHQFGSNRRATRPWRRKT
jgi:hypothetical protein